MELVEAEITDSLYANRPSMKLKSNPPDILEHRAEEVKLQCRLKMIEEARWLVLAPHPFEFRLTAR